jgi:hypothetical protein
MLNYTKLKSFAKDKHSSLFEPIHKLQRKLTIVNIAWLLENFIFIAYEWTK